MFYMHGSKRYILVGLVFFTAGVLHYIAFRGTEQLLPIYFFKGSGSKAFWGEMLSSKSVGWRYFVWASFPSFSAVCAVVFFARPFFKQSEELGLCVFTFVVMSLFEILEYRVRLGVFSVGLESKVDILDLAAIVAGVLLSWVLLFFLKRRGESD